MVRFKRLLKSFVYAFRGLVTIMREEQNLAIQTTAAVIVVIMGLFFRVSPVEWCILIISILLVILMEVANSAVERVTDILKPRIHEYVKEIKDIMAAAVMLAAISSVIVGVIIFYPYILNWLNS